MVVDPTSCTFQGVLVSNFIFFKQDITVIGYALIFVLLSKLGSCFHFATHKQSTPAIPIPPKLTAQPPKVVEEIHKISHAVERVTRGPVVTNKEAKSMSTVVAKEADRVCHLTVVKMVDMTGSTIMA